MSFCIRNGGNDTQEDYYMNRDTDRVLRCLETGLVATIISPKRKPENLTLRVIMETKELICVRVQGARPELTINLKQVKDIRTGKKSSDFDKCLEESHKIDGKFCLVLLYGAEFNLKTLSLLAKDENNFKIFHQGLHELCFAGNNYLEQKDTWIWKQFHSVLRPGAYASYCAGSTDSVSVTFNEIRGWFVRTNCKISSKELKQLCKKLKLSDRLSFNEFCLLFNEFLHPSRVIGLNFSSYVTSNTKAKNEEKRIGFEMFREFMTNEQKTEFNPEEARKLIKNFLNDPRRSISDLHFTEKEFVDYLFSEDNDIYSSTEITDDMHQPLCAYWIASSHNTYVTGNQLSSESSVEPYARCLRMGCRCVELDCWDGTDGTPVIYHGKTLTSKVKLVDVLHVIKENAFYSSEYPVILSLENHCTLPQQRIMAKMLRDTFGDTLLTELIPNTRDELPTPHQLKHKILIKDRKLSKAEVARKVEASKERSGGRDENTDPDYDVIHADIKSGILHLKNTATDMWQTYFCIMNDQVLILTPPKDEEEETEDDIYDFPYEDVYVGDEDDVAVQIWFHGKKKSKTAEEIINNYRPKTSGCFLIRENDKNGYSISFWNNDKTCHCRINYKDGKYYLNQAVGFDNIVEMVEFYQQTPLYLGQEKSILLSDPIPVEPDFLNQLWYHATDRHGAENLLRRATDNGTFLIRPCGRPKCPYSLSVIYNRTIRHFAISREGGLFSIGSFRFLSLEKLVDFFKKRPIAKQMVLKKPATSALLDADDIAAKYADVNIYGDGIYAHVDNHQEKLVSVRALYDYIGDPDTQLSFKRGAIITNVMEIDDPWWKGDHGEQTELLFPANYVEVIDTVAEEEEKLREITIPLETCILELAERCGDKRFAFKLYSSKQTEGYIFACDDQTEFVEWLHAIGNVIQQTEETKEQRQKQEQIHGRAKELSDLMVYCQSVPFQHAMKGGRITEMASISERDMSQYNSKEKVGIMTKYNCKQLSRVYPDGIRFFSSNYDPVQMWQYGCQMVALNYQKADKFLQLNNSLFLRNRRCGYVLKPECMRSVNFSPFEMKSFMSVEPVTITVAVLAGRNIFGGKITTATNPFVSVEIIGLNLDTQKRRTGSISKGSNSLSPIWDDQLFPFDVTFPDLAFLRFEILDESFEKTKTIHAQATYPLTGLRQGFRCVHLNNHFSEKHELSSLLVHIEKKNPMEAEERNVFKMIEELRYNSSFPGSVKKQLEETETKLLKYLDERQKKRRRETNLQGSPGTWK